MSTSAQLVLTTNAATGAHMGFVPLRQIVKGQNPRRRFDQREMDELTESIRAKGVQTAIILRPLQELEAGDDGVYQVSEDLTFELVAGERRYRAARAAHGEDYAIPAQILSLDDQDAAIAALTENVQRANMSPVEEAEAAAKLLAEFANDKTETAKRLGWSPAMLEQRLALMNATQPVREALQDGKILLGHAELIAAADKGKQEKILQGLLAAAVRPTVAQVREMLAQVARPLDKACFEKTDCLSCVHNSSLQAAMFTESIGAGSCTKPECYSAKAEAALEAKRAELVDTWPRVEIVRPGGNYTVVKIKVEGADGVGDDQAKACRQCKNFGVAISAVPGKEGNVYEDMCFDTPCHTRMVARQIKAQADDAAQGSEQGKPEAKAKAKPGKNLSKQGKKPATTAALSSGVVEYRKKLWRKALAAECVTDSERSLSFLVALAVTHNVRHIDSSKASDLVEGQLSTTGKVTLSSTSMPEVLTALTGHPKEFLAGLVLKLSATSADGLEISTVEALLAHYQVDLSKYFSIDAVYLDLLTKSEMQAVAEEVGLDKAIGDAKKFKALFGQKKPDLIKAFLAVDGFTYSVVPATLQYKAAA